MNKETIKNWILFLSFVFLVFGFLTSIQNKEVKQIDEYFKHSIKCILSTKPSIFEFTFEYKYKYLELFYEVIIDSDYKVNSVVVKDDKITFHLLRKWNSEVEELLKENCINKDIPMLKEETMFKQL